MSIHYYLATYPVEALIASGLDAKQFGAYMATGSGKGLGETFIFAEIDGGAGRHFDWDYAKTKAVPHPDGSPKNSAYLSVYRVLEHVDLSTIRAVYLTTRDGRSLKLQQGDSIPQDDREYYIYQELCPIKPLVVSSLSVQAFAQTITNRKCKVHLPQIMFCDVKHIDIHNREQTGHTGGAFDRDLPHLQECIEQVKGNREKPIKTWRRNNDSFSFQIVDTGIYIAGAKGTLLYYPMPSVENLKKIDYDWARSAQMI